MFVWYFYRTRQFEFYTRVHKDNHKNFNKAGGRAIAKIALLQQTVVFHKSARL